MLLKFCGGQGGISTLNIHSKLPTVSCQNSHLAYLDVHYFVLSFIHERESEANREYTGTKCSASLMKCLHNHCTRFPVSQSPSLIITDTHILSAVIENDTAALHRPHTHCMRLIIAFSNRCDSQIVLYVQNEIRMEQSCNKFQDFISHLSVPVL